MSVAKWREARRLEPALRLLLVVNPTADLPGADREGARIAQAVAREPDIEVITLRHGAATRARLLDEFRSGGYDAIHYAGHAFFDPHDPPASGILCAGGRVLAGEDLATLEHLPALVFFNACESGRVRRRGRALRALEQGTGFAEAFLRGGVANFVGTWWPVSDAAAAEFAQRFYSSLVAGEPVGRAVQAGRAAVQALPSPDWADYLHYGSHDFVLKSTVPPRPRGRRGA
jgi:CHAT domain-containing protein